MMPFFISYQPAELYAPKNDTWRIMWYNYNPKTRELERIRKTFELNRIKDIKDRRRIGKQWVALINEALRKGYNYFIDTLGIPDDGCRPLQTETTVLQAMDTVLKARIMGKKKRTAESYTSTHNLFCSWIRENDMLLLPVKEFKAVHFQQYLNYKAAQGHKNRNINDHISYFKTCFEMAVYPLELIDKNPLKGIRFLPKQDSTRFEAITAEELAQIAPALKAANPRYYLYTKFTSHEYIRPYHTSLLRSKDILYNKDLIAIHVETSKNNKVIYKQLLPEMKKLLLELECHKIPGDWYLFATRLFEPASKPYYSLSKRSAELWKEIVIDGMGINKKMYALKHTSAQYYLNENENIDAAWFQSHMEHSSLAETQTYIEKRKTKKIDIKKVKLIKY